MAGPKDPEVAKAVKKEATSALARRNLERGLRTVWAREDGVQIVVVRTTVGIPVALARPLPGRWSIHLHWLFYPIPPTGEFELLRSSFGLNVAGLANPDSGDSRSVVRYDVDNGRVGPDGHPLGRHINVWQPAPIEDNVHYPGFAEEPNTPWRVDDVLAFFLSEGLAEDLDGRIS